MTFSEDASLLLAGDGVNFMTIFARDTHGVFGHCFSSTDHSDGSKCARFSASDSRFIVGKQGGTASIWEVPAKGGTWRTSPITVLVGHSAPVHGVALTVDGAFAITGSEDATIRIWRVADGVEVGRLNASGPVRSLSFHPASGLLAAGVDDVGAELWRCAPDPFAPAVLLLSSSHAPISRTSLPLRPPRTAVPSVPFNDAHARIATARAALAKVDADIAALSYPSHTRQLVEDTRAAIAGLETELERQRGRLALLTSPDIAFKYDALKAEQVRLQSEISVCEHILEHVTDCLHTQFTALQEGQYFDQWLHDAGVPHLIGAVADMSGARLASLSLSEMMQVHGLEYADACDLHLRASLAVHQRTVTVPADSIIAWNAASTAAWLRAQGPAYEQLAEVGWNGASLCYLSAFRAQQASAGVLSLLQANALRAAITDLITTDPHATWIMRWRQGGVVLE